MNIATTPLQALQLKRCEVPLELQANFAAIRHTPLFYANYVRKLNHKGKVQNRVLILTIDHIYVAHPNGDILRCFPYSYVTTVFWDNQRQMLGLVVPKEYDLALQTNDTHTIMHAFESLRGLHQCREPCAIQHLPHQACLEPKDEDAPKPAAAAAGDVEEEEPSRWAVFSREVGKFFSRNPLKKEPPWFTGDVTSHCIGRGYYSLNLSRPADHQLVLTNPNV